MRSSKTVRNSIIVGGILGASAALLLMSRFNEMPTITYGKPKSPFSRSKEWLGDLRTVKKVTGLIKK
ncbi:MAG: hypothetical protein GX318_08965 [Clostridia bacterium]|nr:hypothetical protein [Clostridia bacterium]